MHLLSETWNFILKRCNERKEQRFISHNFIICCDPGLNGVVPDLYIRIANKFPACSRQGFTMLQIIAHGGL
jgi:hypothetical protein